jgi:hypothetical protein
MMRMVLALTLCLGAVVGLTTYANAGGRKFCKQALETHPMAGDHHDLMKQCKEAYKSHMKAGYPKPTLPR